MDDDALHPVKVPASGIVKPRAKAPRAKQDRVWQRMLSGRRLNLIDPSPLDIEIEDIAHGLARVARWNGQTLGDEAFCVAQHSLLVEAIAGVIQPEISAKIRLSILLHDAAEYVIGDMISPFKTVIGGQYRETEARLIEAILRRFGLPAPMVPLAARLAKKADQAAAYLEATTLAGFTPAEAREFFGAPPAMGREIHKLLVAWPAREAQKRFIARFYALYETKQPLQD